MFNTYVNMYVFTLVRIYMYSDATHAAFYCHMFVYCFTFRRNLRQLNDASLMSSGGGK